MSDMVIDIEGSIQSIESALSFFDELPEGFRPLYFTDTEGVIDKENDLCANRERFEAFKKDNPLGFILYATDCEMDVSFSEYKSSSLFIEVKKKSAYKQASDVLAVLAKAQPIFGYAGMWKEIKYRNGTFKDFGDCTLEWWVGRDANRYVPGLYWLTLLSKEKLKSLSFSMESLSRVASPIKSLENDTYILAQFYDKPENWEANKARIDDYCHHQNGVFSKASIQNKLDEITDRDEYDSFMAEWP